MVLGSLSVVGPEHKKQKLYVARTTSAVSCRAAVMSFTKSEPRKEGNSPPTEVDRVSSQVSLVDTAISFHKLRSKLVTYQLKMCAEAVKSSIAV